jgi:hypothetical protein
MLAPKHPTGFERRMASEGEQLEIGPSNMGALDGGVLLRCTPPRHSVTVGPKVDKNLH